MYMARYHGGMAGLHERGVGRPFTRLGESCCQWARVPGYGGIHDHTGAMQGLASDVTDVPILPSPQRPLLCSVEQKHALPAHVVARPPSGVTV